MLTGRTILLVFILVLSVAWLSSSGLAKRALSSRAPEHPKLYKTPSSHLQKLKNTADLARTFSKEKGLNTSICLLIDMSLPSGQSRFFVYDLKNDAIKNSGLVTHGRCNQYWLEGRKYGNTVGCGCTSLGRYKIGHSYKGRFGLAYKLHGLDKTNDRAFQRFVVLHAHDCVPETDVKDEICQSDGCPTVSTGFLQYLKPIIDRSGKPVLLWIYD